MSMHEIEDLVEMSIRALDAHDTGDLRDVIAALYAYEAAFDCSFTNGRVIAILEQRRYSYRFEVNDHPLYGKHKKAFDTAKKDKGEVAFVGRDIVGEDVDDDDDPWPPLIGHEDGYVTDGSLFCDVATPLWRHFVEAKRLGGADAEPPAKVRMSEVAARVAEAAVKAADHALVAEWYAMGPHELFADDFVKMVKKGSRTKNPQTGEAMRTDHDATMPRAFQVDEAAALPDARRIRRAYWGTDAAKVELPAGAKPHGKNLAPLDAWWWKPD